MKTHSALLDLSDRNTTSLSFVAFERSIEADPDSTRSRSKLLERTLIPNGRTIRVVSDLERFKGIRALLQQRCYQNRISLAKPRQNEFPEVDTAR